MEASYHEGTPNVHPFQSDFPLETIHFGLPPYIYYIIYIHIYNIYIYTTLYILLFNIYIYMFNYIIIYYLYILYIHTYHYHILTYPPEGKTTEHG